MKREKIQNKKDLEKRDLAIKTKTVSVVETGIEITVVIKIKIEKMKKGDRFRVKTPTSLASVRGTEFLTRYVPGEEKAIYTSTLEGEPMYAPSLAGLLGLRYASAVRLIDRLTTAGMMTFEASG